MRVQLTVVLWMMLLTGANCQGKRSTGAPVDSYSPRFDAGELSKMLDSVVTGNRTVLLSKFFIDWNSSIPPNTMKSIGKNDTIQAVFDIFKTLYVPGDLLKLGNWEWGNKLNVNAKYVAVQNSISYAILKSETLNGAEGPLPAMSLISNFRPIVDIEGSRVLYLTDEYKKSLNYFLGTQSTRVGEGNIMNPSFPKGESEERYTLIRSFLPILHGHWGGYWHLATHPEINHILFNRQITQALVAFRVGYQGGEARLIKDGDTWKITDTHATWIE